MPISDETRAPVSTVLDDHYNGLGERIRVSGVAAVFSLSSDIPPARRETLNSSAQSLFAGAQYRSGLRPMTPDGRPVVGVIRYPNLLINAGHGTFGWTMAAGSALVISEAVAGRASPFHVSEYGLARYS